MCASRGRAPECYLFGEPVLSNGSKNVVTLLFAAQRPGMSGRAPMCLVVCVVCCVTVVCELFSCQALCDSVV